VSYQYIFGAAYPKGRTTRHAPLFITQPLAQKYAGKMRDQIVVVIIIIMIRRRRRRRRRKTMFKAKHCIDKRKDVTERRGGVNNNFAVFNPFCLHLWKS